MEGIKIEIIDWMGKDRTIPQVARGSFDNGLLTTTTEADINEKDLNLLKYLAKENHTTPFRHPHVMIRCTAPVFLVRQLFKHQVGLSANEVSRRYVDSPPVYFSPDVWRKRPEKGIKQGSGGIHPDSALIQADYNLLLDMIDDFYCRCIEKGVCPEQARMALPLSLETKWIWTGSLLAFAHVYNLRSAPNAQKEARDFADLLNIRLGLLFPQAWKELTKGEKQ